MLARLQRNLIFLYRLLRYIQILNLIAVRQLESELLQSERQT